MSPVQVAPQVITDYTITSYVHVSEAQDLSHLWDYFEGMIKDPVTGSPIITGVPEPSTWAMMLPSGFAGLGFASLRERYSPDAITNLGGSSLLRPLRRHRLSFSFRRVASPHGRRSPCMAQNSSSYRAWSCPCHDHSVPVL